MGNSKFKVEEKEGCEEEGQGKEDEDEEERRERERLMRDGAVNSSQVGFARYL